MRSLSSLGRLFFVLACGALLLGPGGGRFDFGGVEGAAAAVASAETTGTGGTTTEEGSDAQADTTPAKERAVEVEIEVDTDAEAEAETAGGAFVIHSESGDLVRVGQSHTIDASTMVSGDAVVIGGNLDVHGKVGGDAVVVGGILHLYPDAFVGGEAVAVGGRLIKDEGAFVGGQEVSIGTGIEQLLPWSWYKREVSPWTSAGKRLIDAIARMAFGFLAILIFVDLFGERTGRIAARAEGDSFRSGLIGLLGLILLPITILVLVLSCIGILLLPVLGVVVGVAMLWGFVATSFVVGRTLGRRFFPDLATPRIQAFVGFLILGVTAFVGGLLLSFGGPIRFLGWTFAIAGKVILGLALLVGFGSVLATRFGRRPKGEAITETPAAPGSPASETGL
ncbi:MAG: hypothetical protein FJY73_12820 [Candidatus Eisenbacteria bacterium]|nr:hypothetical protein [Candidatus Eisenbacteria bacterium]